MTHLDKFEIQALVIIVMSVTGMFFIAAYLSIPDTSFNWSNVKTLNVSAHQDYNLHLPDNYSLITYHFQNLSKAALYLKMSDKDLFLKLWASPTFVLNCNSFDELKPGDTAFYAFSCHVFRDSFFFMESPYSSFSKLPAFLKQNCTTGLIYRGWVPGIEKIYNCKYQDIKLSLDNDYV